MGSLVVPNKIKRRSGTKSEKTIIRGKNNSINLWSFLDNSPVSKNYQLNFFTKKRNQLDTATKKKTPYLKITANLKIRGILFWYLH